MKAERGVVVYPSVDQLQKALRDEVFHYAQDSKKAAGRALGTLVEIITFYALKSWGFESSLAIERPLPEFANDAITHNVEYSLHPSTELARLEFRPGDLPLTSAKIVEAVKSAGATVPEGTLRSNALLSRELILRNSCTVYEIGDNFLNAYLDTYTEDGGRYSVSSLRRRSYAIFECKRVGVEEGMRKGPQTIEKAKQGAYVARTVSALQKVRRSGGTMGGFIEKADGTHRFGDYYKLMAEIIASSDHELLSDFILTVGIVSNHGNWFTAENQNKEMKVLAQSYDWLLFLTDAGVSIHRQSRWLYGCWPLKGAFSQPSEAKARTKAKASNCCLHCRSTGISRENILPEFSKFYCHPGRAGGTPVGLAQFVDEILLNPKREQRAAREAFRTSYTGKKGVNQFTKVKISLAADAALQSYFTSKRDLIEDWFNVIAPRGKRLSVLRQELTSLSKKNWQEIHS